MLKFWIFAISIVLVNTCLGKSLDLNNNVGEKPTLQVPNRCEIINVFKRAIELNEDFKNTVDKIPFDEYQKKREETERYDEEVLSSKVDDCVKILSSKRDNELAFYFFKLLISYENSADEQLSYSLAEIFLNNPGLIEETFHQFKRPEQEFLYKSLEWGWRNVIYYREKNEPKILDRIKKLEQLKLQLLIEDGE